MNAGGALKTCPGISSSDSFGGLGGGGGPGFVKAAPEDALDRVCVAMASLANFPASANGGGALNRGAFEGGDGVRAGEASPGEGGRSGAAGLRDGGGAGGGPLLDAPVLSGVNLAAGGPGGGGGGGGALLPFGIAEAMPFAISFACFSSTYALMKSAF